MMICMRLYRCRAHTPSAPGAVLLRPLGWVSDTQGNRYAVHLALDFEMVLGFLRNHPQNISCNQGVFL